MADATAPEGSIALSVVTPTGSVVDTTVGMVTLPGIEGDFGIMPGHTPFFTTVKPGVLYYDEGGMPKALSISAGYVEVAQDKVIVLARTCEQKDEIDEARANKAKTTAEEKLASAGLEDDERINNETKLARADARIAVAKGERVYG